MEKEYKIEDEANALRNELKTIEKRARKLMTHGVFGGKPAFEGQHGEMKAQIMLTVRHVEDARMRLGKVCQYAGDGTSIYDKG